MTRAIIALLIFFGILYYFQAPLQNVSEQFGQLHSPYVLSFKKLLNDVVTATSSSVINGYRNYIPGLAGAGTASDTLPVASSTISSGSHTGTHTGTGTGSSSGTNSGAGTDLLPVTSNEGEGILTSTGIVSNTNVQRVKVGLPSLFVNKYLTASAEAKLHDMFQNQYFAHVSPSGENVSNVVSRAGYDYIVVGENLALGLFPTDASVVAAWMASPGHKKNILDSRYKEIGVAVGQGMYQGRKQWLIVQHFGKPLASCPSPSANLKQSITEESAQLSTLEQRINAAKAEVEQAEGKPEYESKVNAYNELVTTYNQERDFLKEHLDIYNESVRVFNACIQA
jgi:uncharacterized protein YkwD